MNKAVKEDLRIWDLVHNWCEGLQVEIPDMARRYLMGEIEQYANEVSREVAEDAFFETGELNGRGLKWDDFDEY